MKIHNGKSFEMVCHVFHVQIGAEFYSVIATGNRYKIVQYFKQELGACSVKWLKSMLCRNSSVFNMGKRSKIVARDGFVLKMEFMYELGTIRSKALNDIQDGKVKGKKGKLSEVKNG